MPTTSRPYQLIDLDRVILDTALFVSELTDAIRHTEPELGKALQQQFEAAYAKEETFFLLRYLRQTKGDAWLEALARSIVEKHGVEAFLLPGAAERLERHKKAGQAKLEGIGIITFGDRVDQYMKLHLLGLDFVPVYITDTPDKAQVFRSWKLPDGAFQLPEELGGHSVAELTFEDDKLRAFDGLPEGVHGVWITQFTDAEQRLSERGLEHVGYARSLTESSRKYSSR